MTLQPPARRNPYLFLLCLLLWVGGLGMMGLGLFFLQSAATLSGILALTVALLVIAAGLGLFWLRRWGVILFGLLALLGSMNHLSTTFIRHNNLSNAGVVEIIGALVSILVAILIPIALIYMTLLLWRQST